MHILTLIFASAPTFVVDHAITLTTAAGTDRLLQAGMAVGAAMFVAGVAVMLRSRRATRKG